jgi:uncharacterized protein with HEPN domain
MQRDEATLLDIAKAARLVQAFIQGPEKEAFLNDYKTQSAVLYQLIVMGEAVKRLSDELRTQHLEIPWSLIAGMRDHLIHGYDVVDSIPSPIMRLARVDKRDESCLTGQSARKCQSI